MQSSRTEQDLKIKVEEMTTSMRQMDVV